MTFRLADRHHRLASVRLVQELGLAEVRFSRDRVAWSLHVPRPPVDRMEYLFEIEDHNARRTTITDPDNGRSAPGAFGAKSVVEFPGYVPPRWLDGVGVDGTSTEFEIDVPLLGAPITGALWSPATLDPAEPAPLLVVHDGPEYDALGNVVHFASTRIADGTFAPLRVALVAPGERTEWYAANAAYTAALVDEGLPGLAPATQRIGLGASLGALAMLHAHRSRPGTFDALLLQSGSFFTPDLDGQESRFGGFAAVTRFVASVHESRDDPAPVPIAITCGIAEENLANNRRMSETLARLGYQVTMTTVRDGHNYVAWRDALHPSLTDLVATVTHAP